MWENHRKRDNLFFSYASNIRKHVTLPQSPSPSSSTNIAFIKMYYSARGPLAWDAQCNSPQASERVFTYITALTLTHILFFFFFKCCIHTSMNIQKLCAPRCLNPKQRAIHSGMEYQKPKSMDTKWWCQHTLRRSNTSAGSWTSAVLNRISTAWQPPRQHGSAQHMCVPSAYQIHLTTSNKAQ